ncbi:hypothetical protein OCC_12761 [Thermococcus litoralis DSM 5473]|uniref:DUF7344 domain-containing protein n=1 Tax=Thermococcus litoralis (strain ATCC 51850 / DSM 5473 / JCM 8560 / NS-C) TaxID=523849 RepID=H3ZP39_THELN|nr:hypothetical protein [Thermococcus litoralis]EHR78276.1 hypothetical protein OCC_12761 [Thermococcus litoralis DSM 5473]
MGIPRGAGVNGENDTMSPSSMILGNDRRMLLLRFLQDNNGKAELREIVDFIAENEGQNDRKHRKSVYVSLLQTHIPKMERAGIIKFDHNTVNLLKVPEDVDVYMEVVSKHDISWSTFYSGVSVLFALLGIWLNNIPLVIISAIYFTLSIIQHFKTYRVISRSSDQ